MPSLAVANERRHQHAVPPIRPVIRATACRLRQNRLLEVLPDAIWDRLAPQLQLIEVPCGTVLHESCSEVKDVYFPTNSIVSLVNVMRNGASAQTAMIGFEGVVGLSPIMGGAAPPSRAVVQVAGHAFRLKGNVLAAEFERGGPLAHLLMRYTQALLTQMAQTAVCNRHHSLEQQLCRWLLMNLDRLCGFDLLMTHEMISNMLGVRREGVTEAAGRLQRQGLITYSRGHITVLDRAGLEAHVCECYAVVRRETERLLPNRIAT